MIKITIPRNNINERKYILDIFFNELLGLEYELEFSSAELEIYDIELTNGNRLIFEDHFFNNFPQNMEYLKLKNIPSTINYQSKTKNKYILENDIPIIYGTSNLKFQTSNFKTLTCAIDIFASSFFMLTRWEEYVNKNKDTHNRFPATESLSHKQGFLDRPIVNEYVEMLKNMLLELGLDQKPKTRNHQLYLTHDVDELYMWKNWKHVAKVALGDIVKRRDLGLAYERFSEYFLIKRNKIKSWN